MSAISAIQSRANIGQSYSAASGMMGAADTETASMRGGGSQNLQKNNNIDTQREKDELTYEYTKKEEDSKKNK